jgi:hypothetical protein
MTSTEANTAAPDAVDEPAAKPARQRAERVARAETDAVPAGYLAVKSTPAYDQFRKADPAAEGPEWLTRCNAHGKTTEAKNRKAGRALGAAAARATWCAKCKTAAK